MDFSKLSTGDKLVAAGAALFLISTVLPWFSLDTPIGNFSANGWDYAFSGVIGLILLLAAAALVVLPAAGKSINAPAITLLALTALATLMVLVRFLIGEDGGVSRSIGIVLAVISAGAATFGAFTKFKAAGGNLDDLKDPTKLKNQMQSGFSSLAKDLKEKGEDLKDKGGDVDKVEEKFDPKD